MYILPIGFSQFELEKLTALIKFQCSAWMYFNMTEKTKTILMLEMDTPWPHL